MTTGAYRYSGLLVVAGLLSGCISNWDMQGHDPKDYYAEHPIANTVETRYESHTLHFLPGHNMVRAEAADELRNQWNDVSPMAVESVQVELHPSQVHNQARRTHISKLLRRMGYPGDSIMFEPSENVMVNDAELSVAYAAVVLPHCPDWRTSPITSYSNTWQGNFGCASTVNLGMQVADPRDLVKGSGTGTPDTSRTSLVVKDYRGGKDWSSLGASSGGASASSGAAAVDASSSAQ